MNRTGILALACVLAFGGESLRAEAFTDLLAPVEGQEAARDGVAARNGGASAWQVIEEKDVLASLREEIVSRLGLDGELRLSFAQPWGSLRVPADADWEVAITQLPSAGVTSSLLVRFRIDAGERKAGEWQTILRAQLWKPVWVATRRLDRGVIPDAESCAVRSVDVLREKQSIVPAETDLSIYEMSQTLSQERPIAWRDIVPRPLVRKGETVDVVVNQGPLQISMKGTVLGNAGKDEKVLVRNPDSRNSFTARVVGANTVQVDL